MDWIWYEYTTSPDPVAGMQSLSQTCSTLTKHILLPSHIVLSGGGFTLLPELAEILMDIIHPLGQLLNLAMQDSELPNIQPFCHTELQILTCTTGLDIATQNQIVWSWIHLVDKVYIAMVDLKCLYSGRPIHVLGCKHPSTMPQILAALPSTLRGKLPVTFLRSYGIMASPPATNTRDIARKATAACEQPRSHVRADVSFMLPCLVEAGGHTGLQGHCGSYCQVC
jgi:hypothetical protein